VNKLTFMSTIEEIQSALAGLSPEELRRFSDWFEGFSADLWDRQWEEDVKAGNLEKAADQAIANFRAGRCTEL
jgi:hypothetical protein